MHPVIHFEEEILIAHCDSAVSHSQQLLIMHIFHLVIVYVHQIQKWFWITCECYGYIHVHVKKELLYKFIVVHIACETIFTKLNSITLRICACSKTKFWVTTRHILFTRKQRRWRSGLDRSPCKGKVGCSNPICDRPKVVTASLTNFGNRCDCHGSSEMTIINRCPDTVHVGVAR